MRKGLHPPMKACRQCRVFFQESTMSCDRCGRVLSEVTLTEALSLTRKKSFKEQIHASDAQASDAYKQYLIRRYLGDGSLFLLFDLCKNRLKHGKKPKRFLIQPVDFTAFFNIPWFVFNIISTNMFHLQYTGFCARCGCKSIPGYHSPAECDYNIEYFSILDDILSGDIVDTKVIYEQHGLEMKKARQPSAYHDLFLRKVRSEFFFDVLSIGLSIAFWLFLVIFVAWPVISSSEWLNVKLWATVKTA